MKAIRFSVDEAQVASDAWGFNCGPAALCAVLDKTPTEIRPYLHDFETRRYTNPSLMRKILDGMKVRCTWTVTGDECGTMPYLWPDNALIRIQWGGPWTEPTAHIMQRQRHTHWIACRHTGGPDVDVFDVNATCAGGWLSIAEWSTQLVPWLLKECEPKADGRWWQTHRVIIQ